MFLDFYHDFSLVSRDNSNLAKATSRIATGCPATPVEVANTSVFLASDAASDVSGAVANMDGATTPTVLG